MRPIFLLFLFCTSMLFAGTRTYQVVARPVTAQYLATLSSESRQRIESYDPWFLKWQLSFAGFPENKPFYLWIERPLFGEKNFSIQIGAFCCRGQKLYSCPEGTPRDLVLSSWGFLPGEEVVCQVLMDKKVVNSATFTPRSLFAKREDGRLFASITLAKLAPTSYLVSVVGAAPQECYQIHSTSNGESLDFELQGNHPILITPGTVGADGGVATLTFQLCHEQCSVDLPWGGALKGYLIDNR